MQHGTGYPDLDKIMEDGEPLCFEFELLRVEQPGEYKQEPWAMTDEDKLGAVPMLKEEGNNLYKNGEHKCAAGKYYEALSLLEGLLIREQLHSEPWYEIAKKKIPLLLNYTQCMLLLEDYAEAIRHTTTALEIEPENVKALYRRGKAHSASWNVDEAKSDLRKAAELDPSLANVVERELRSLAQRVREKDALDRDRLQGKLFN